MGEPITRLLESADATETLGSAWGQVWRQAGHQRLLIGLYGDLGTGKTTWVRGLLRGQGVTGPVRSPTYTLVEPYEQDGLWIVHADLYRLGEDAELTPLGLDDWLELERCWVLVEWPERAAGLAALCDLALELTWLPHGRQLTARAKSAAGEAALSAVNLEEGSD